MTWLEPEINLSILSKTFTLSTNTFKNVWPIRKVYFLYHVFLEVPYSANKAKPPFAHLFLS